MDVAVNENDNEIVIPDRMSVQPTHNDSHLIAKIESAILKKLTSDAAAAADAATTADIKISPGDVVWADTAHGKTVVTSGGVHIGPAGSPPPAAMSYGQWTSVGWSMASGGIITGPAISGVSVQGSYFGASPSSGRIEFDNPHFDWHVCMPPQHATYRESPLDPSVSVQVWAAAKVNEKLGIAETWECHTCFNVARRAPHPEDATLETWELVPPSPVRKVWVWALVKKSVLKDTIEDIDARLWYGAGVAGLMSCGLVTIVVAL